VSRVSPGAASAELAHRDAVIARLVAEVGPCRLRRDGLDHFGALARSIVYQQLAGKAAAAIHGRFESLFDGPPTAESVLALPESALRGVGLSASKTASILDLAAKVQSGAVVLDRIARLPDERIIERLVTIRGIGRWTAEMFLIFQLGRIDVWPVDDFGVRAGYAVAYGLPEPPTPRVLAPLGEAFRPYRSVAAWYCWRAIELSRIKPRIT